MGTTARAPVSATATARCPSSLEAIVPDGATRWVIARPRALFEHPRLGRIMARAFDDAGDQALFDRARRVGYDVRTIDEAVVAWSARTTWSAGVGTFDARRIEAMLWERLLPPRGRMERAGVVRVEGTLGRDPVALALWSDCAFAAYGEGPTSARANEQALRPRDDAGVTRDAASGAGALLRWHDTTIPAELDEHAPTALLEGVHDVEVSARASERGLLVDATLEGRLPRDAEVMARRALDEFARGPLGESVGAPRWARATDVAITGGESGMALRVEIPWAALDAMADVLRGRVGESPTR